MVQNKGREGWIWVRGGPRAREDAGKTGTFKEGSALLKDVTERMEDIQGDGKIPVQPNKTTGAKSKKQLREEVQTEAAERFKEIAMRYGWVSGKWMVFAPVEKVDSIWEDIATSLVSGPLAATRVFPAKVATSSAAGSTASGHLICLYMPDVYDRDAVTEVITVLARHHGTSPISVKPSMCAALGMDSKHPSGVQSAPWKNTELLSNKEFKALRKEYNAELKVRLAEVKANKSPPAPKVKAQPKHKPPPKKENKPPPRALKRPRGSDGSESDYEDEDGEESGDDYDPARMRMRTGAK
ncbi:translation initiation factor eIF 4e-like domain-containing protein [Mycena vulgaris]|nr:translation initiation factor eIF 4e-like domain-containing protein [Mycena vulgaris]